MARILVQYGKDEQVFDISEGQTYSLGRGKGNQIPLSDAKLSRLHCTIHRKGDEVILEDSGSQNGTYVNRTKIHSRILMDGDVINIGLTRILFEQDNANSAIVSQHDTQVMEDLDMEPLEDAGDSQTFTQEQTVALQRLESENSILMRMQEIAKAVNSERDLGSLLTLIMDSSVELLGAARGYLVLLENGKLVFKVARGRGGLQIKSKEFEISKSIATEVAKTGKSIFTTDAQADDRFSASMSVIGLGLASIMCVPLKIKEQTIGVLYLDNPETKRAFTRDDLNQLTMFADQAAIALENTRLYNENLEKNLELQREKDQVEKLNGLLEEKMNLQAQELETVKEQARKTLGELQLKYNYDNIIGKSPVMQKVFKLLDKVVDSHAPVLIQGPSGTGKELVAKAIHFNGAFKNKPFISENVGAISPNLLESELFGHERGAFTGAVKEKKGLFELANGGTLFLDEIGEMDFDMQKKLLRALQEGEIRHVGGKETIKVKVRIISATNKDLRLLIEDNAFREDLFYRLNVFNITLPALAERKEDIPLLIDHFLDKIAKNSQNPKKALSRGALTSLLNYDWPGNIRELENEMERASALSDNMIDQGDLSPHVLQSGRGAGSLTEKGAKHFFIGKSLEAIEREAIRQVLEHNNGKKVETARMLCVPRKTLYNKLKKYLLE